MLFAEEGLEIQGVVVSTTHSFSDDRLRESNSMSTATSSELTLLERKANRLPHSILLAMASCHTVVLVNGVLIGDNLELKLLEFSGWTLYSQPAPQALKERKNLDGQTSEFLSVLDQHLPLIVEVGAAPSSKNTQLLHEKNEDQETLSSDKLEGNYSDNSNLPSLVRVVHIYHFTPSLKRMSVIVWDRQRLNLNVYCKGAPEEIRNLCDSVPFNFSEALLRYTSIGMRVLAVASKSLKLDDSWKHAAMKGKEEIRKRLETYTRDEIESNLVFNGFVVFANKLKPNSREVIMELSHSGCRCVMSTGDDPHTASETARAVELISNSATLIVGKIVNGEEKEEQFDNQDPSRGCGARIVWELHNCYSTEEERHASASQTGRVQHSGYYDFLDNQAAKFRYNDLRDYLNGRDPRDVVIVLTGPAFRLLKEHHYAAGMEWSRQLLKDKVLDGECLSSAKKRKGLGQNEKQGGMHESPDGCPTGAPVVMEMDEQTRSMMTLRIAVCKKMVGERDVPVLQGKARKVGPPDGENAKAKSIRHIEVSLFEYCLRFCRVFSRMTPDDKALLVQQLQELPLNPVIVRRASL